jgi:hypothetical protein
MTVSTGFLANWIKPVSETLKKPYEQMVGQLPEACHVHMDETRWKERGKPEWVWAFKTALVTVFTIARTRGKRSIGGGTGEGIRGDSIL